MRKSAPVVMLYVTFPNKEEAAKAARVLIELKLAACVNILPGVTSVYRWEGKVEESEEIVLIAKTSAAKRELAITEVKRLHSYSLPCIIAYPAEGGFIPFLQWVVKEVGA